MLDNAQLHYPEAKEWMWTYCIYLGPYTDKHGKAYDLGVYINPDKQLSAAIVYGSRPGDYISGEEIYFGSKLEVYKETFRRAHELQL